jgi:hypothetical protein
MRLLITLLTYVVSLAFVASAAFVAVIVVAGPHAGLLPAPLEAVALGLGWLAVLALPALAARAVWRRMGRRRRTDEATPPQTAA